MNDARKPRQSHNMEPACALAGAALAWWIWGGVVFVVLAAVFTILLLVSIVRPSVYAPIHRFQSRLTGWLLAVVTWVILSVIFAVVFIPAGIVLRFAGRRTIAVGRAGEAPETYWTNVEGQVPADYFTRQF